VPIAEKLGVPSEIVLFIIGFIVMVVIGALLVAAAVGIGARQRRALKRD
jgi:hypothetical protein